MIFRYKIKFISDIEQKIRKLLVNIAVTPFVGVWIEIVYSNRCHVIPYLSLPSWECGLKYNQNNLIHLLEYVTPFVGVWIEIDIDRLCEETRQSLPSWECGLKWQFQPHKPGPVPSLPSWECGLKLRKEEKVLLHLIVTPFVGVWIEISRLALSLLPRFRHSLRGSVD